MLGGWGILAMVLNAFRHHRGGHMKGRETIADYEWCSTPFGITEGGMPKARSAIRSSGQVLNAFRHHRGGHAREFNKIRITLEGAQRLSASQRGA